MTRVISLNCNRGDYRMARERRCLKSLRERDSVSKKLEEPCKCSNSKARRAVNATRVMVVFLLFVRDPRDLGSPCISFYRVKEADGG